VKAMKKVFQLEIQKQKGWEITLKCPFGKTVIINTDVPAWRQFPESCQRCREFQTCLRAVSS